MEDPIIQYILFVIGFVALIKGADWLVNGAISIADKAKVPEIIIGLTIVSFGTSLPELIINILSSMKGKSEIAIGNIFGSNISNILLILGITSLVSRIPVKRNTLMVEIPFSIIATLLVGFLANVTLLDDDKVEIISTLDGFVLLSFFVLFLIYIYHTSKEGTSSVEDDIEHNNYPIWKAFILLVIGFATLAFGGHFTVKGAVFIAAQFGLSDAFIGLTIMAIGTSLPELVTSIAAARKGSSDIVMGNVIGSNIFNLLWILGLSGTINPLHYNPASNNDILLILLASVLIIVFASTSRLKYLGKLSGSVFLSIYVLYMIYLYLYVMHIEPR